jgi:iron complex outermembrane receptor protein
MLLLKKITRHLQFVFFSFFSVCSIAQNGIINGMVKDGETALPSATISIANKSILTNSRGEFSIALKPGTYMILVTHAGYKSIEQSFTLNANETRSLEFAMIRQEQMDEIVVLGSRSFIQRSNLNTAVPVDLISGKQLKQTGHLSLIQMMSFVAPSLNTSRQNLWEPVTLRGLGPDHMLILLNGSRHHNTAYVNNDAIRGTLGVGAVGNDLSAIPFSAIEKIEILRDGASAQYGSDAIGGVMNIILKETTGKTSMNLQLGQQYKGDGESIVFGINRGIKLNKKGLPAGRHGIMNFSGDFRYRMPTHRGGEYMGTVYYNIPANASARVRDSITTLDNSKIAERGFSRKTPVSNDGNIKLSGFGILINGAYPVNRKVELFWTVSINYRYVVNQGAYRFPKTISQVNTDLFPDGFKSEPLINSRNISAIAGVKGKTNTEWNWEWRSSYGENSNTQRGRNTNNASQFFLGANAPIKFYGGKPIFRQQINTISFAKDVAKKTASVKTFNIGLGAEHRYENFRTLEGEEAAWKDYDSTGIRLGGAPGSGGIRPEDIVNESRNITALYVDLESDINEKFLINVAGRYEYYSDFGSNLAGKIAMRYKFSPRVSIRSSLSNGYHAPALQQTYLTQTSSTAWKNIGGINYPVTNGIFPNNSVITKAFGVRPLQPEKAINVSTGFTSTLSPHLNITVDGYWIQIKNRIVLSGIFDKSNPDVNTILINRPDIDQVRFMTNAINTRTRGIDIVMNGNWKVNKGNLGLIAAANFTRTTLFGPIQTTDKLAANSSNENILFNREEREKIEHSQPASKIILSANYNKGKVGMLIRSTRFGETSVVLNSANTAQDEFFSAKIFTDINFNYSPKTWLTITAGINNVFDVYPDPVKNPINQNQGILIYSNQGTPYGYNGGYYFVTITLSW